jgi:hypothetical protein
VRLNSPIVPKAGPFRQGNWNGREFVIVQRRLFPAIVCWLIGGLALGWVGAAKIAPRSQYVPEPEQFRLLLLIGGAFLAIGAGIALWTSTWVADPGSKALTFRRGPIPGRAATMTAPDGLWLAVHPLRVAVRGAVGWSGYAATLHASPDTRASSSRRPRRRPARAPRPHA